MKIYGISLLFSINLIDSMQKTQKVNIKKQKRSLRTLHFYFCLFFYVNFKHDTNCINAHNNDNNSLKRFLLSHIMYLNLTRSHLLIASLFLPYASVIHSQWPQSSHQTIMFLNTRNFQSYTLIRLPLGSWSPTKLVKQLILQR